MPTPYPKCSVSELSGLLVLLDAHRGSDDIARLADDLDLEIDEILPSVDFAETLDLLRVSDGTVTLTETGRAYLKGSIRGRKTIIRDQLKRTTLFRILLRAMESAPDRTLSEEDVARLLEVATGPSEEVVQNIINWGRYAELFRYDAEERKIVPMRRPPARPPSKESSPAAPADRGSPASSAGQPSTPPARSPPATGAHPPVPGVA
ncbi:MAG: AAA-associated domain-containing protein [Thermoplasmata archaeon]